jgi:hypothetical protein
MRPEGLGKFKKNPPHRDWYPRPLRKDKESEYKFYRSLKEFLVYLKWFMVPKNNKLIKSDTKICNWRKKK